MIISMDKILQKYKLNVRGVIHIGAHYGQEYDAYKKHNIQNMMFFEPVKSNFKKLIEKIEHANGNIQCYNVALGNKTEVVKMFIETANQGQSCSLLEPKEHLKYYPKITFDSYEKVCMTKLDLIPFFRDSFNMINIDVQGYELEVFKGASETLKTINIIYAEVNKEQLYKDCTLVGELDSYLKGFGFKRELTQWTDNGWGDALYLKN